MNPPPDESLGVVIIGRNEGDRFERCLRSLVGKSSPIVYVDSGSTDSSVAFAEQFVDQGVHVLRLDMSMPFTAARARNAGLERALEVAPATRFVQFVDGDCEVRDCWLGAGVARLREDATLCAVSGRLRERFPEKSLYNRLADLEWDRPVGEEKSCGGVAMMRVEALRKVGGFDPALIAGEEPELCARMRAAGYRVWRIADEMAWHDMAMFSRAQWLTRARRHGHAIIEVSCFKTRASRGLFAKQLRSALVWGLGWPVFALVSSFGFVASVIASIARRTDWAVPSYFLITIITLFGAWGLQSSRIARQGGQRGLDRGSAMYFGSLTLYSKVSQVCGMIGFLWKRLTKRQSTLIDYREMDMKKEGSEARGIKA